MTNVEQEPVWITTTEHTIRQPVSCLFEPKEDITAFELATLLQYFHGKPMYEEDLTALGATARHLRRG